jgi:multicomponent Na+:H+ antiporter subunit B
VRSLILERVARWLLPVATLFALYLLLRGHNQPGGGFIAGLVTGCAVVLQAMAFGARRTRRHLAPLMRVAPWVGVTIALASGLVAVAVGQPFLTHYHQYVPLGANRVFLSTTLIFDIGVYLAVVGVAATVANLFAEGIE